MTRVMTDYPPEVKAEGIALAELHGYRPAARIMRQRYPQYTALDYQLLWYWHRQIDPERFVNFRRERLERFEDSLIDLGLHASEALFEVIEKDGPDRHIAAGIAMDKPLKLLQIRENAKRGTPPPAGGIQIVIQSAGQAQVLAVNQGETPPALAPPEQADAAKEPDDNQH